MLEKSMAESLVVQLTEDALFLRFAPLCASAYRGRTAKHQNGNLSHYTPLPLQSTALPLLPLLPSFPFALTVYSSQEAADHGLQPTPRRT